MAARTSSPPEPSFVFDSQAWTAMASQLSRAALPERNSKAVGEKAPRDWRERYDSAGADEARRPGMARAGSSPSLASIRRRRRAASPHEEGGAGVRLSKSLIVPSEMSRPSSSSSSTSSGTSSGQFCGIHPQVRVRSGRCPRCAAGEKMLQKSFRKGATAAAKNNRQEGNVDNSFTTIGRWENDESVEKLEDFHTALHETNIGEEGRNGNGAVHGHDQSSMGENIELNCVDEEVEEVSLDEKWADALRFISQRLADQKGEAHPEIRAPAPQLITLDQELQETIERATQSIGQFADEHEGGYETEEGSERYDASESSIAHAAGTPATKIFAETKGERCLPPIFNRYPIADALTTGLEQIESSAKLVGTEVMASNVSSCPSLGSDSSVTLSIGSSGGRTARDEGNCSSLPQTFPEGATSSPTVEQHSPNGTRKSFNSPKCVIHDNALEGDSCDGGVNRHISIESKAKEDKCAAGVEREMHRDFDNSFFAREPKVHSEQKSTPLPVSSDAVSSDRPVGVLKSQSPLEFAPDSCEAAHHTDNPIVHQRSSPIIVKEELNEPQLNHKHAASGENCEEIKTHALSAASCPNKTVESSPTVHSKKPQPNGKPSPAPSFFSALVHNSRARSKSRPRSKSQSRTRSKSRGRNAAHATSCPRSKSQSRTRSKSRGRSAAHVAPRGMDEQQRGRPNSRTSKRNIQAEKLAGPEQNIKMQMKNKMMDLSDDSATVVPHELQALEKAQLRHSRDKGKEAVVQKSQRRSPQHIPTDTSIQADTSTMHHASDPQRERGPITHPDYKLGDLARDEDMLVFPKKPKSNSRNRARSRRRRRRRKGDDYSSSDESSSCDEDDEKWLLRREVNISLAIGQLRHLDAAFVRRSDGQWTYALVADGDASQIRFVVNDRGSTKAFPKSLWKSCVRRVRVLTPRRGDRLVMSAGKTSRKKRSIGRSRGRHRGGSRGKGRLVSPSPTRRNSGVLNLPPTIYEE